MASMSSSSPALLFSALCYRWVETLALSDARDWAIQQTRCTKRYTSDLVSLRSPPLGMIDFCPSVEFHTAWFRQLSDGVDMVGALTVGLATMLRRLLLSSSEDHLIAPKPPCAERMSGNILASRL